MKYRKLGSDLLFNGNKFISDPSVVVVDENGIILDLLSSKDVGDDVEFFDGLLAPGFVNCHCHLELSGLEGKIPRKSGMIEFLLSVMHNRNSLDDDTKNALFSAHSQLLQNGIVVVGDICNTPDTIEVKKHSSIYFHNFIEVTGFVPNNAIQRYQSADAVLQQFRKFGNGGHQFSIVPHAPYSVSAELFKVLNEEQSERIVTIHNQESEQENIFFKTGGGAFLELYDRLGIDISFFSATGESSLQSIHKYLGLSGNIILVHNIATSAADVAIMNNVNTFWCLCPKANLYIQDLLPPERIVSDPKTQIVIGTDSLASNDELSILSEIQVLKQSYPSVSTERLLSAATFVGAKALGVEDKFGMIECGRAPGIIQLTGVTDQEIKPTAAVKRII